MSGLMDIGSLLRQKLMDSVEPPDPELSNRYFELLDRGLNTMPGLGDVVYNNKVSPERLDEGAIQQMAYRMMEDKQDYNEDELSRAIDYAIDLLEIMDSSPGFEAFSPEEKKSWVQQMMYKFQQGDTQ